MSAGSARRDDAASPATLLACLCALAIAFVWLTVRTWGGWADPLIDFGNDLYIAWQLAEGQTLYADIAHRNGPFSHALNALLFGVFGVGLWTLVWANLVVLALCCVLAFTLLRRMGGLTAATSGVFTLLGVFAFGQYVDVANYNFVAPYHHFQTHGIALGLVELFALLRWIERGEARFGALAGLVFGALFLTKLELWLPGLAAAAVGAWLAWRKQGRAAWRGIGLLVVSSAALPVLFGLRLAAHMPWQEAVGGVLGNLSALSPALLGDPFYRSGTGLDAPAAHLGEMGAALLVAAGLAGAIVAADRMLRSGVGTRACIGVALVVGIALWQLVPARLWFSAAGLLPAAGLGGALVAAQALRRDGASWAPATLLFAVWALGLLAKLGLAPRFHHYGFALAMPASLLLACGAVAGLPALARRYGGRGDLARAAAIGVVAAAVGSLLGISLQRYDAKTTWVGPPDDAIRVEDSPRSRRGPRVGALYQRLDETLPRDASLLVYPEGAFLNFWLRRPSSSRFVFFLPTELDAFGRDVVRADLRDHPPDYVVLAHRGHADFGTGPFGGDERNGRGIVAWMRGHYDEVWTLGPPPFTGRGFGAELWRRSNDDRSPRAREGE